MDIVFQKEYPVGFSSIVKKPATAAAADYINKETKKGGKQMKRSILGIMLLMILPPGRRTAGLPKCI